MTSRRQILVSALIVGSAAVAVAATTLRPPPAKTQAAAGHDHAPLATGAEGPVHLDGEAARRIGVTFATAQRKPLRREVSTTGIVAFDETRVTAVTARIEGWVEKLHVDYTGASVRAGQPLLEIYSPALVAAQEELLLASALVRETGAGERAAHTARELLDAARARLRSWAVGDDVIAAIERNGRPVRTFTLRASASGVVLEKNVVAGARVMPGMELYRLADLRTAWVEGEVFERDIGSLRLGQPAELSLDAYPGEVFRGTVAFISPVLSQDSRTARVRIVLDNTRARLMPGMYARVELVSDAREPRLVLPRDAVHFTGQRAVVFVELPDGSLAPRTITTGGTAGDEIIVLEGVGEGEKVVAAAGFLVDAESRLGTSARAHQ